MSPFKHSPTSVLHLSPSHYKDVTGCESNDGFMSPMSSNNTSDTSDKFVDSLSPGMSALSHFTKFSIQQEATCNLEEC